MSRKSRRRNRRSERTRSSNVVKPSPLSLSVRAALRRPLGLTSALTLGVMLSTGFSDKALAADVTVATPQDVLDGNTNSIAELISTPGGAGISLREAVIAANNTPGVDTINLPVGTFTLIISGIGEDASNTGDLDIASDITIQGAGQTQTVIDANSLDRVLHVFSTGSLTLKRTTVTGGRANFGGGVANAGTVTLTNSTVSRNNANDEGGGIFNNGPAAKATLINSTVSRNGARYGGGIANRAAITLTRSYVSGNSALAGGGIANRAAITLTRSHVSGNSAISIGGGIFNFSGTATLINSTVSGNSASLRNGGGIYNDNSAMATLNQSTVSSNSASLNGGGIYNQGIATLTHSTVSGNSANIGGGVYNVSYGTATVTNSLIANSMGGNCDGSIIDGNFNLADDGSCGASIFSTNINLDPLLADNGGPTRTHALLAGSAAIDAVPSADCTLATDQRGVARPQPQGGNCDIGAYEFADADGDGIADERDPLPFVNQGAVVITIINSILLDD